MILTRPRERHIYSLKKGKLPSLTRKKIVKWNLIKSDSVLRKLNWMDSWPDTTFAYTDTPLPFLYFAMQFSIRNGYADVVCNVAFFIGCCACLPPTFSPHRAHTHTHLPHSTPHGICIYSRLIIHWNQFHLKFDFLSYSTVVPFILWLAFWMRFDLVFHARYANWQARILSVNFVVVSFSFILFYVCVVRRIWKAKI